MTRLYTFTISHFAEKARWSLDYKGIHYQEKRLVPGSHVPIIKRIAPSTFVPVLQDAGRVIQGSSAIIDYVDEHSPEPPLTPADSIRTTTARSSSSAGSIASLGSGFAASSTSTRSIIVIWPSPYSTKADLGGADCFVASGSA